MTTDRREEMLRLAKEAGLQPYYDAQGPAIERFAALVERNAVEREREACARIIEAQDVDPAFKTRLAAAIRARNAD